MAQQRSSIPVVALLGGLAWGLGSFGSPALAADPVVAKTQPNTGQQVILDALRNNPVTAPYRFGVATNGRQYALSGRVGTKYVHDAAIQTVIATGYPVRDDLTIDTREMYRLAAMNAAVQTSPMNGVPAAGLGVSAGASPYVYPPPLFGRLDDPFYGFEPPLVSYAPWFGPAMARREPLNVGALTMEPADPAMAGGEPLGALPPGAVEMTIDTRGVATLRGRVSNLAERVAVGQKVARTAGVTEVVNLLEVGPDPRNQAPSSDVPPPPPTPVARPIPREPAKPAAAPDPPPAAEAPAIAPGDPVAKRVTEALGRRPALAAAPVKVSAHDGVATLSGRVGSSYEAMLAFRAAQQTPGVREVVDRLEFPIPDVDRPNPIQEKGRAEDVEPYLLAQVRRQVGDLAHVDQVRVQGDALEIKGTVSRPEDVERVEATLRSIPLLRGFRIKASFPSD